MAPEHPSAQRNQRGETFPSVRDPIVAKPQGLSLPQGGLATVFSAAFATPDALPGVVDILRDEEFLTALSQTASFISERGGDDALRFPQRAVQILQRMESSQTVRSAGRSLIFGCAELFANPRLYLEPQGPSAGESPRVETDTQRGRLHRLCTYLSYITNLIQDGASQFQDPTLWKIIDDEFIARIHAPLAHELSQLCTVDGIATTAVLTAFERLDECAQSLDEASRENREIVSLLTGFILRRLTFVLNNLTSPEVRSVDDSGLRDHLAEKLAHKLGLEIEQYRARGAAPLMQLLRVAEGEGYSFIQGVFSGFLRLHGDFFRRKAAWSADSAVRRDRLLQGYETLGACASILWPAEFSGLIREHYSSLDPYHRAAALQILQYAVADDPRSLDFVLCESIRLLGHGDMIVRDGVCRVLSNLAVPLADFLGTATSQDRDTIALVRKHQLFILKKVFVPFAKGGELSLAVKSALWQLLIDLIHEQGVSLFRDYPSLARLMTWEECKSLDAKERQRLVYATMEAYGQQASSGVHGDQAFVPNRDREETTAAFLAGLGPPGLLVAFQYATELTRSGNRVGALGVRLAAARAAREIPEYHWTPIEKTAFTSLIFGDVFASFHEVVQRKVRLMSGAKQPPGSNWETETAQAIPERKDDLDLLVSRALARQTLQGSLPEVFLNDPAFVCTLAALEGEVIRSALNSPLIAEKRLPDFIHRLGEHDLQAILTQYVIEKRLAVAPVPLEPSEKRLAKLIESYSTSPLKSLRAQQTEFGRIRHFLVQEIEASRLPYPHTPEINRVLGVILDRALRESLLGSSEVYRSGDEELHLALDVFAAHLRKGENAPHHACRRFLACWFKVFPPTEPYRHVRVSTEHVARVIEAVVHREGDTDWAGKAVYLLASRVESLFQASRGSTDALKSEVVPLTDTLARCVPVIGSQREIAFEKNGVTQRHAVTAVAFRVLEQVRSILKPTESARPQPEAYDRIPRIPFEYRHGSRVHVPGLNVFPTALVGNVTIPDDQSRLTPPST